MFVVVFISLTWALQLLLLSLLLLCFLRLMLLLNLLRQLLPVLC
jgi:hypothetical protein